MKRFLAYVSQQPWNYSKLVYDPSGCLLNMEYEATRLPILPLMNAVVKAGETVEVILVCPRRNPKYLQESEKDAFDRNLGWTREEIGEWAEKKGVTVTGMDRIIDPGEPSNMREMLGLYEALVKRVNMGYSEDDVFYSDITFGTKPMTLIQLYVLRYIHDIKKNPVEQIVYGQVYRMPKRDEQGQIIRNEQNREVMETKGELHELTALFQMDSLVSKVGGMNLPHPEKVVLWSLRNAMDAEDEGDEDGGQ